MARRGRQEFSVQEAVNMDSFGDWNYEVLDLNDDPEGESTVDTESSTYITSSNPAKKIVIYEVPGQTASFLDATDTLTLTINGESDDHKKIVIDAGDLPFTLSGLLLTSLSVAINTASGSNQAALLSFH